MKKKKISLTRFSEQRPPRRTWTCWSCASTITTTIYSFEIEKKNTYDYFYSKETHCRNGIKKKNGFTFTINVFLPNTSLLLFRFDYYFYDKMCPFYLVNYFNQPLFFILQDWSETLIFNFAFIMSPRCYYYF